MWSSLAFLKPHHPIPHPLEGEAKMKNRIFCPALNRLGRSTSSYMLLGNI